MYDPETSIEDYQKMLSERQKDTNKQDVEEGEDQENDDDRTDSFREILSQIEQLVLMSADALHAELEVHIGRIKQQGGFDSQVSEVHFTTLLERFEQKFATQAAEWERIEEFVFPSRGRAAEVRLRRNPDGVAKFIQKTNVHRHQVEMKDGMYDFSIVLNSEHASHINYGQPRYLRFKERKTFVDGDFAYTFTKVWPMSYRNSTPSVKPTLSVESGSATRRESSLKRETERDITLRCDNEKNRPTFEIELELSADWNRSVVSHSLSKRIPIETLLKEKAQEIAYMILLKIIDLVGRALANQAKWQSPQYSLVASKHQTSNCYSGDDTHSSKGYGAERDFQQQEQYSRSVAPVLNSQIPRNGLVQPSSPPVPDNSVNFYNGNGSSFPSAMSYLDKFYQDIALAEAAKRTATMQTSLSFPQQSMQFTQTPTPVNYYPYGLGYLPWTNSTTSSPLTPGPAFSFSPVASVPLSGHFQSSPTLQSVSVPPLASTSPVQQQQQTLSTNPTKSDSTIKSALPCAAFLSSALSDPDKSTSVSIKSPQKNSSTTEASSSAKSLKTNQPMSNNTALSGNNQSQSVGKQPVSGRNMLANLASFR